MTKPPSKNDDMMDRSCPLEPMINHIVQRYVVHCLSTAVNTSSMHRKRSRFSEYRRLVAYRHDTPDVDFKYLEGWFNRGIERFALSKPLWTSIKNFGAPSLEPDGAIDGNAVRIGFLILSIVHDEANDRFTGTLHIDRLSETRNIGHFDMKSDVVIGRPLSSHTRFTIHFLDRFNVHDDDTPSVFQFIKTIVPEVIDHLTLDAGAEYPIHSEKGYMVHYPTSQLSRLSNEAKKPDSQI